MDYNEIQLVDYSEIRFHHKLRIREVMFKRRTLVHINDTKAFIEHLLYANSGQNAYIPDCV